MRQIRKLPIQLMIIESPVVALFIYGIILTLKLHLSFGEFISATIPLVIVGLGLGIGWLEFRIMSKVISDKMKKLGKPKRQAPPA